MNWHRIDIARARARGLFMIAGLAILVAALLQIVAPKGPTPMFDNRVTIADIPATMLLTAIGIGGVIFGLVWMWRIYKAPTKDDSALWRYRDRG